MKRAVWLSLLFSAGCASWRAPVPGPTADGIAVRVTARERGAARREAFNELLPLFVDDATRRQKTAQLEKALSNPGAFFGRVYVPKKGGAVVEVRVDALSAALRKTGTVVPAGYDTGPENVLIAFGDRAAGLNSDEHFTAGAFETALFGRGIQAQDADDDLLRLKNPITAKTEAGVAAQAAALGWPRLVAGRVFSSAVPEPLAAAWRATAKIELSTYDLGASTIPTKVDASGEAVDVSSAAAVARALETAAQAAAVRIDGVMSRRRGGRATLGVLVSGRKDPAYLLRVVKDLRSAHGIVGASLVMWDELNEMVLLHAYADGIKADELAARLLQHDTTLRIDAIETEDGRLTLQGPDVPMSEDRGE